MSNTSDLRRGSMTLFFALGAVWLGLRSCSEFQMKDQDIGRYQLQTNSSTIVVIDTKTGAIFTPMKGLDSGWEQVRGKIDFR